MTKKISKIPSRIENAQVDELGNPMEVAGAKDILDDDLQLRQSQINAIVLGGSITPNLTRNKTAVFVGTTSSITLTATISTPADSIKIFKYGVANPIATGSDTSLPYVDSVTPSARGNIQYYAEFKIGGLLKRVPSSGFISTQAVDKIYTGVGTTYAGTTMVAETNPHAAGNFTKQITTASGDYMFIEVPDNFKLTTIELVSTYPTTLGFTQIESTREGYKAYINNEPRGAGNYTYRFTIAND